MRKEAQLNIEKEIIAENQSRNVVDTDIEMIIPGTAPVNSVPVNPVAEQPVTVSCEKHADRASAMLLSTMREKADNRAFRHLYSCRKYIGGIIVFCKRVVRKCLKWYIEPVCDQQSDFNHATVAMTEKLFDELASVNTVTSDVQNRLNMFESQLRIFEESQQNWAEGLRRAIDVQHERVDRLEDEVGAQRERADRLERAFDEQRPRYSFGEIMSHSQSGEDTIVAYILDSLKIPFNQCT